MKNWSISVILVAAIAGSVFAAPGTFVRLRGQGSEIKGDVSAQNGGVLVAAPGRATQLIAWNRVRETDAAGADGSMTRGLELMRAVSRIERGDFALAAEAIEPLMAEMAVQGTLTGPTGMVAAETAMRVRLARGSQTGATLAWLAWLDASRERPERGDAAEDGNAPETRVVWVGERLIGDAASPIDSGLGLCVHLPPIFGPVVSSPALVAMLASSEWGRLGAGPSGAVVRAYEAAARYEVAGDAYVPRAEDASTKGDAAAVVRDIVLARAGSDADRGEARKRLRERLERLTRTESTRETEPGDEPGGDTQWLRAWLHLGIGRSLIREAAPEARREGVVELLTVAAIFGSDVPGLAAGALVEARLELVRLGEPIDKIEADLRARFPEAAVVLP